MKTKTETIKVWPGWILGKHVPDTFPGSNLESFEVVDANGEAITGQIVSAQMTRAIPLHVPCHYAIRVADVVCHSTPTTKT